MQQFQCSHLIEISNQGKLNAKRSDSKSAIANNFNDSNVLTIKIPSYCINRDYNTYGRNFVVKCGGKLGVKLI